MARQGNERDRIHGVDLGGQSLCWKCANAVPSRVSGCEWSEDFQPVPGWDAEMSDNIWAQATWIAKGYPVYHVYKCPKFVASDKVKHPLDSEKGLTALAMATIKTAAKDYELAYTKMRKAETHNVTRRTLYGARRYRRIYGAIHTDDYMHDRKNELLALDHFFDSSYAGILADIDYGWLRNKLRESVEEDLQWDYGKYGKKARQRRYVAYQTDR